jgi:hypothetical protein
MQSNQDQKDLILKEDFILGRKIVSLIKTCRSTETSYFLTALSLSLRLYVIRSVGDI